MFKSTLLILISFTSHFVFAEKVQLEGKDGFKIYADFTQAQQSTKNGVLMLHQCNADRSMYAGLAKSLSENGISSMSLDFRGFGESVTDQISLKALRAKATSRENYFEMVEKLELGKNRVDDVEIAYQYLINKLGSDPQVSYIGASCGGAQIIQLAQNHKPNAFVFFSSGLDDEMIGLYEKVSDVPSLIIAAVDDEFTYKSLNKVFDKAQNPQTRKISYKGNGHGLPLFEHDTNLENSMTEWFKQF